LNDCSSLLFIVIFKALYAKLTLERWFLTVIIKTLNFKELIEIKFIYTKNCLTTRFYQLHIIKCASIAQLHISYRYTAYIAITYRKSHPILQYPLYLHYCQCAKTWSKNLTFFLPICLLLGLLFNYIELFN